MFVWSVKTTRPRLVASVAVLALLAVLLAAGSKRPVAQSASGGGDDAARVDYLQRQGYAVDPQWIEVREMMVPRSDTIPVAYQGKRVKCFTYAVEDGNTVRLYEYNGKIIGSDKQGNDDGTTG